MGTRSLTVLQDKDGTKLRSCIGRWTGYPKRAWGGSGNSTSNRSPVVNGFGRAKAARWRMVCHARQLIAKVKVSGHFYLYPAGTRLGKYILTAKDGRDLDGNV